MNEVFEYRFTVLESHLDTFGHVNNATYLQLYEEARWDFITKNGYGLDKVRSSGVGPVILEANIVFKKELKNREEVLVKSQTGDEINPLLRGIHQEMFNSSGELASILDMKVGVFDTKARKLVRPNEEWLRAIGVKI